MPKNSFNSIDARSLTGEAANTAIKILSKLDLLDDEGIISVLPFGKAIQGTWKLANKITDPHKAARHSVGVAVGTCFAAGLHEFGIEQFELNESEEKRFKAAIELAKKEAKVDLKAFDVEQIEKTEVAQRFLEVYKQFYQKADPLHYEKNLPRLEGYTEVWLTLFWRRLIERKPERFSELEKTLDRESFRLEQNVINKLAYQASLANMYLEPSHNDKDIRLSDLYIMPRCEVLESISKEGRRSHVRESKFWDSTNVGLTNELHELVLSWLAGTLDSSKLIGENHRLLLLYGMPGQGKTSFCKRVLYDVLKAEQKIDRPVYFLKLRTIPTVGKLKISPLEYIAAVIQDQNKIEVNLKDLYRSIVVLDGMDELAMSANLTMSEADLVIQELLNETRNQKHINIIVTSRHGYLKNDQQLSGALVVQLSELEQDQQEGWIERYQRLKPESILSVDAFQQIAPISPLGKLITQPILLQMVADLDKIPDDSANRASLYQQLFDFIVNTPWKVQGKNIEALAQLGQRKAKRLFRHSLQEMAYKMFRNGKNYMPGTVIEEEIVAVQKLMAVLGRSDSRDTLKTMYISFYFREIGTEKGKGFSQEEDVEYAIEFVHKSFSEFLVAEYVYRQLQEIYLEEDKYGDIKLTKKREALAKWNDLISPRAFSNEIVDYLIHLIQNDSDSIAKENLKSRLVHFSPFFFDHGFLLPEDTNYYPDAAIDRGIESFYMWMTICGCLSKSPLLTGDSKNRQKFLKYLRYSTGNLHQIILEEANLAGGNLAGAYLERANLQGAYLQGAHLTGAYLEIANLERANLEGGHLQGAQLAGANLQGASLQGANLQRADLQGANLQGVNLQGGHLQGANLRDANLQGANLELTKLQLAYLQGANLQNANLWGTNLQRAKLQRARLQRGHLQLTKLQGADLQGADLEGACLERADLEGAYLQQANLQGVKGIKFEQLLLVETLFKSTGLDPKLVEKLRQERPCLFEEHGCD